jgi:hypothetical protein
VASRAQDPSSSRILLASGVLIVKFPNVKSKVVVELAVGHGTT